MKKLISTMMCLVMLLIAAPVFAKSCILVKGAKVVVILQDGRLMKGIHPENVRVQIISNIPPKEIPNLKKFTGLDWSKGKLVTFGLSKKDNPEVVQEVYLYAHPASFMNCR